MNIRINPTLTEAEKALIDQFDKASENLPGAGQAWMEEVRARAIQSFKNSGLPHRRLERWKFTDLRNMLGQMPPLAQNTQAPVLPQHDGVNVHTAFSSVERYLGVFVDGYFRPELSNLDNIDGLEVVRLCDQIDNLPRWVEIGLGQQKAFKSNSVLALNTAFAADGVALRIKAGAKIEKPIHLSYMVTSNEAVTTYMRNLIVVEKGGEATIVETYAGPENTAYVVNTASEISVDDEGTLTRITVQDEGHAAFHLANMQLVAGANSRIHDLRLTLGASVSRNEMNVEFTGENADITLAGASMLAGKQHGDTTLCITHNLPSSNSRQEFKTVLDDSARGVFQGCVIVKPHAQHTDGRQMTQALLLSPDAEMDAKPELEIYADDVECAHGATAGDLDEDYLFYLRARGIPENQAKALLVAAFVAEPLEKIKHEGLREGLFQLTNAWFDRRKSEN
jgi:Fe-S cluster assembly protein SufD